MPIWNEAREIGKSGEQRGVCNLIKIKCMCVCCEECEKVEEGFLNYTGKILYLRNQDIHWKKYAYGNKALQSFFTFRESLGILNRSGESKPGQTTVCIQYG